MSDLISRSELLKVLNNKNVQITFDLPVEEVLGEDVDLDDFLMLVQDAVQAYKKMIIDAIKNQPIAYDLGNVVEELKKLKNEKTMGSHKVMIKEAIEIVKQGDVLDDVCEWKVKSNYYVTECSHDTDVMYGLKQDFKFCPYCGKKIKVVE